MVIDFSGTAGHVRQAFHTEIHHLEVNGTKHIANMSDPQIPAAVAAAVAGVVSLNDFRPHPMYHRRANYNAGGGYYLLVPGDVATIYNFNPLFAAGYSGQGQTIVVVEDTDVYSTADWNTFRTTFGLAADYPSGSFTQVHPPSSGTNNCSDPGVVTDGSDGEAILDAEWASAAAPNAAIELASCADTTTTFGELIALQNLLNASGTPPAVVSNSWGDSETDYGATVNAAINALYQQAVTLGVSVFVAAGDEGAAESDSGATYATHGINVDGEASTPYNVAVGGTDYSDTYSGTNGIYWNLTNGTFYNSALSYIPEIPWNDSCASVLWATYFGFSTTYGTNGFCNSATAAEYYFLEVAGGSGGPSACAKGTPSTPGVVSGTCAGYAKPSWQSVVGNPSDGVRDLPDLSLFAGDGGWAHYYVFCWSNPSETSIGSAPCTGAPNTWAGGGGTSFASPIMAGIQALINQYTGSRWGNPNPTYYSLARTEYGTTGNTSCNSNLGNGVANTCIFYDVTSGDMDVPCTGTNNCYLPSGTYGVLSTSNSSYQPAYGATVGWDFASGIGTVNAYNLAKAFSTAAAAASLSPSSLFFGTQLLATPSAAGAVTLTNSGGSALTITSIAIAGANSSDFGVNHNCPISPNTLAAGSGCTLHPTFTPQAAGPRKSSISISDNSGSGVQTILLTGVGTAISTAPSSLTFSSQQVGTPSGSLAVVITNEGGTAVNLWQITFLGADAGDFSQSNTSTCGNRSGAGANCMVNVIFTPAAAGSRTASLVISDDGGGSPQAVTLAGMGTSGPVARLSTAGVIFGEQAVGTSSDGEMVVLTNAGDRPLAVGSITVAGASPRDFAQTNACGASLAPGASCTIAIRFTPRATGTRTAVINVLSNHQSGSLPLKVQGTGIGIGRGPKPILETE